MIEIKDKAKCCGCTACANICPRQCITMEVDEEGFRYPHVNEDKCVHCNLCNKVCPVAYPLEIKGKPVKAYIVRNKDEHILMNSSSGGFFYALCDYVIERHGVVYGVKFDEDLQIVHARATTKEECLPFLGSKYVQSRLGSIYREVKKDLQEGLLVCFSGTPCQVQGLVKFLNNENYYNLILMDIVCHGVSSEKIWNEYLDYERKQLNESITGVSFRSKRFGYNISSMHIKGVDNEKYESTRLNPFLKAFFSHISLRPSCSDCPAKSIHRVSDFTVFDSWHAAEILHKKDDDKGYSNVLVQTEKAMNIIEELGKSLELYEIETEKVITKSNAGMIVHSATPHVDRSGFMKDISEDNFNHAIAKYVRTTTKDVIIEKLKLLVRHSEMMRKIARAKRDFFRIK